MGVAVRNVSGMMLHSALNLNERRGSRMTAKSICDLITKWEGVDFLFIDKVLVIRCKMIVAIHEALCTAKGNDLPFGGVNVIFAGDFGQLLPIAQSALYKRSVGRKFSDPGVQANVFGRLLWLSVSIVVLLVKSMRQAGEENIRFVELLDQLHEGRCTDNDYQLLQSRMITNVPFPWEKKEWYEAPIIVYNNEVKDALNEKATLAFAQQTGQPVHWYACTDSVEGRELGPEENTFLMRLHSGETHQCLGQIPLVIGMPVMIT